MDSDYFGGLFTYSVPCDCRKNAPTAATNDVSLSAIFAFKREQ